MRPSRLTSVDKETISADSFAAAGAGGGKNTQRSSRIASPSTSAGVLIIVAASVPPKTITRPCSLMKTPIKFAWDRVIPIRPSPSAAPRRLVTFFSSIISLSCAFSTYRRHSIRIAAFIRRPAPPESPVGFGAGGRDRASAPWSARCGPGRSSSSSPRAPLAAPPPPRSSLRPVRLATAAAPAARSRKGGEDPVLWGCAIGAGLRPVANGPTAPDGPGPAPQPRQVLHSTSASATSSPGRRDILETLQDIVCMPGSIVLKLADRARAPVGERQAPRHARRTRRASAAGSTSRRPNTS